MSKLNKEKWIHFFCTGWFVLCVGYILVLALRQAGLHWWAIFSLSGHSAVIIFLLISLYLFTIYKGIDRSQKVTIEHPLTSTGYFIIFYDVTPLLGGLAGYIGSIGVSRMSELLLGIALGTLVATFLVWIVVDPTIVFIEKLLPASRKHRLERLAQAQALQQQKRSEQESLLAGLLARDEQERSRWRQRLKPQAQKLAELLMMNEISLEQAEYMAVEIGADAWQMGGLGCMQQLRDMAVAICRERKQCDHAIDYIPVWWDGVGGWRNPSLC